MNAKPKVAFYWCASCGGCEEAVLDLAEGLLDVAGAVEVVLWPVAMDFKRHDAERLADGEITATFINGAIRSSEQEEMAHLLRKKSKYLVAFGSCAQLGGVPGLANLWNRQRIFNAVYRESPTTDNPSGTVPQPSFQANGQQLSLPVFYDTVRTVGQTVEVDYIVPGCPPTPELLNQALKTLLSGELPEKGTVLAPDRALCEECPRLASKPEKLTVQEFKRPHQVVAQPDKCLLAQGLVCLGPATRAGCGALCIQANMPCTGCFGPVSRVRDFGAKAAAAIASVLEAKEDQAVLKALEALPDPVGTFYRYSLPACPLRRRRMEVAGDGH